VSDLRAAAAERHLTVLVAMTDGGPIRVVLALGADDLVDFLFHQFGENAQPDAHAQRQQSLLCCPNQLAQRLLHTFGEHGLIVGRLRDRYGLLHGGSSFDLGLIGHHAPKRSGRARRDRRHLKFYELRDNLGSFGFPANVPCDSTFSVAFTVRAQGAFAYKQGNAMVSVDVLLFDPAADNFPFETFTQTTRLITK
jgi:hypothetical protein